MKHLKDMYIKEPEPSDLANRDPDNPYRLILNEIILELYATIHEQNLSSIDTDCFGCVGHVFDEEPIDPRSYRTINFKKHIDINRLATIEMKSTTQTCADLQEALIDQIEYIKSLDEFSSRLQFSIAVYSSYGKKIPSIDQLTTREYAVVDIYVKGVFIPYIFV